MSDADVVKARAKYQLLNHPVFSGIPNRQIDDLMAHSVVNEYAPGEMVFRANDMAEHLYFVRCGTLKQYRMSADGHEKVLDLPNCGDLVALASLFISGQVYGFWCQALELTQLLEIPRERVVSLINSTPAMGVHIISELSCQLHEKIDEIDSICLKSAANRFAEYLLQQASECKCGEEFALPAGKSIIASKLAITPETLSRLIGSLKRENVLETRGTRVVIRDEEYLRGMTAGLKSARYY